MPRFNFTFQEASPLITYTGLWAEGTNADPFFQNYDGSFRDTNASGSQATLIFTGTGFSLFGAMRPNHGNYATGLDNGSIVHASGNSQIDQFQLPLRQIYGLSYQQHTVQVTNEPTSPNTPYFDLDFVQIERTVGQDNDTLFVLTIDDTSPLVNYVGPWEPSSAMSSSNNNSTLHQTLQSDSTLSITFQGCCIELYGLYTNAAFTVTLDNGLPMQMVGQDVDIPPAAWHPQTLLYVVDGLSEHTNHTVSLTTTLANEQRPFFFDYTTLRSTQNFSSPLPSSSTPVSNASKRTPPVAAIAGASIGGAVLISLVVAACIFWRRRRRASASSHQPNMMTEPENSRQPRPGLTPWSRDRRSFPEATITAWYPPSGTSSQAQDGLDTRGETLAISSGTLSNGLPPNTNSNSHSSKRRGDFGGHTAGPARSVTTSVSHARGQSGSGESSTPSALVNSSSQRSRPQGSDRGSDVMGSTSAPQEPVTTRSVVPVREEDAGILYSEDQMETLPPAYNPGWNPGPP